ncbi:alpha/beta fold hydrolase [Sphingomonas faeni]|uniref:alpha/beta fold hydrolase n=1 Tax=Sphingomonas faeni TaxID=185950 RepID=UPI0027866041|nr:alpha/beta fold hydrolase [Sphingomonas faeni]MDQ0840068.1 pimeloyl-ACP methyl ester carboxylesterase [Sphingomonas faeni]
MAGVPDTVNVPLSYDDSGGTGPVVVLIHGVGLSRGMWAAQVPLLETEYRVIAVDMLGHGDSARPPEDAGLDSFADHIVAVLDHAGVDRGTFIGFSMGALVARAVALRHRSRVEALVLLNGVFDRSPDIRSTILARVADVATDGPAANIDGAIERWFSPAFRNVNAKYIADLRTSFVANDPAGYAVAYRLFATEDCYGDAELSTINVPTLVATGEYDVGSTPAMARSLAARIPGAVCRVVENARHMMPVEMADATNALLLDFLATIECHQPSLGD